LLLAVLVASSCGSSHHAATTQADTTQQTATTQTTPSGATYSHLAFVSARSGEVLKISDLAVESAASDGDGGWFVSGDFGLARMLPDGKLDSAWGAPESRKLKTCGPLIKSGPRLYLARFRVNAAATGGTAPQNSTTNDEGACVLEALDAATGRPRWIGSQPFAENPVITLAASSTRVYAGGDFSSVGKAERRGLAAFDAETGKLLDWRIPPLQIDSPGDLAPSVSALTLTGSRLYIGGFFSSLGGERRDLLAAIDPSTGALLSWKPPKALATAYIPVQIAVSGGQLIVPGEDGFAAVSLSSGRELAWRSKLSGTATTLAVDGSLLYLGGNIEHGFSKVGGQVDVSGGPQSQTGLKKLSRGARHNLAALDLETGRFTSWAPDIGFEYVDVGEIVPSGEQVLVVGAYTDSVG
jgi:hypothetical protein